MWVNLLPHREVARQRRRQRFQRMLLLSLLAGLALAALVYLWLHDQLAQQRARNRYLQAEIALLDAQIKEVVGLEEEIASLHARQKAVEDLQMDRNLPVHLLAELARQVPDGVYVSQLRQQEQSIELKGVAQSSEQVSEMLRNMADKTPWFAQAELQEIAASTWALSAKESHQVVRFQLHFRLLRAAERSSHPAVQVAGKAGE